MPGVVLCSEPFDKMEFLDMMIGCIRYPVVFVDMDLLYTGYVESGMIHRRSDVMIFHPGRQDWVTEFSKIVSAASRERTLVVIDSLNGIHGTFDDIESAGFVNSCIMLLASLGRQAGSPGHSYGKGKSKEQSGMGSIPRRKADYQIKGCRLLPSQEGGRQAYVGAGPKG